MSSLNCTETRPLTVSEACLTSFLHICHRTRHQLANWAINMCHIPSCTPPGTIIYDDSYVPALSGSFFAVTKTFPHCALRLGNASMMDLPLRPCRSALFKTKRQRGAFLTTVLLV
ncbi:hypothetical protein CDAR_27221 [Caerostris darwini]|uniref:Uncharacterized protein n=1 Tax=Caerostris darwini TaxID=1538125 RepID=A0AAV4TJT4_9ARAC|nr:hypothetical protein CDAR_27221 [Caerostris darwini]